MESYAVSVYPFPLSIVTLCRLMANGDLSLSPTNKWQTQFAGMLKSLDFETRKIPEMANLIATDPNGIRLAMAAMNLQPNQLIDSDVVSISSINGSFEWLSPGIFREVSGMPEAKNLCFRLPAAKIIPASNNKMRIIRIPCKGSTYLLLGNVGSGERLSNYAQMRKAVEYEWDTQTDYEAEICPAAFRSIRPIDWIIGMGISSSLFVNCALMQSGLEIDNRGISYNVSLLLGFAKRTANESVKFATMAQSSRFPEISLDGFLIDPNLRHAKIAYYLGLSSLGTHSNRL